MQETTETRQQFIDRLSCLQADAAPHWTVDRGDYLDAIKLLESWGKREIKRVRRLGLLD